MKYTQHLVFALLLTPTAAVLVAAALSLATPQMSSPVETVPQYAALENQP